MFLSEHMLSISKNKQTILFIVLAGLFITNAILAEFIGVKIFSLEKSLGFTPLNFSLLGIENLAFNLTAGVLLWPVVFILTDIINEYFGPRGVRFLSYLASALIVYAFIVVFFAVRLQPADFWPTSHITGNNPSLGSEVGNLNTAYSLIFGQGLWIILGSLIAFIFGQILDVYVFHKIKEKTGENGIWLRSTGSTIISQFIDSYIVLFIAFYFGAGWSLRQVLAIGTVNYIYKFLVAVIITPLIYIIHHWIEKFLGKELASKLKLEAMNRQNS